jgi:hypothetical protein
MTIKVPSQFTGISSAAIAPPTASSNPNSGAVVAVGTTNASCKVTGATAQTINVCSLDPTKRLEKVTITFNANVSNSGACGQTHSDNWLITPFTGSGLTGSGFTESPVNGTPYTLIQKTCLANIAGQVWHDRNNDGTRDPSEGEAGQSGFVVAAFDSNGFVKSANTGNDGSYTITNVPSGVAYTVCEFSPAEANGFEYRGWFQSVPNGNACSGLTGGPSGMILQPSGNTLTLPAAGASNVDFLNVRTVTVTCSAPGDQTFTVGGNGDPLSSITISAADCKPGEFVFESFVFTDGTQETDFYPVVSTGGAGQPATQTVAWALTTKAQSTLVYDDNLNFGFRPVLFCNVNAQGNFVSMPTGQQTGATTCLMNTTENPSAGGVQRTDTLVTLVDGKLRTTIGS